MIDEKVYVFTFRQHDGNTQLRIHDTNGRFIRTSEIELIQKDSDIDRVSPYAIGDGKLYQFVQDEADRWVLRSIEI